MLFDPACSVPAGSWNAKPSAAPAVVVHCDEPAWTPFTNASSTCGTGAPSAPALYRETVNEAGPSEALGVSSVNCAEAPARKYWFENHGAYVYGRSDHSKYTSWKSALKIGR